MSAKIKGFKNIVIFNFYMETKFIPLDYSYFDWHGRNYIEIIGRTKEGKRVVVIDAFEPYFWAILKPNTSEKRTREIMKTIGNIKVESASRITRVLKTEIHDKKFLGRDVKAIKIFVSNYKDSHAVADKIDFPEIEKRREYDISLISRYIMDKKISPLVWYDVKGGVLNNSQEFEGIDSSFQVDLVLKAERIGKSKEQPNFEPRILAFDVEADEFEIGRGNLLMISLYGEDFKKVLTWKHCSIKQDFVECFKDEGEMLEKFVEYVHKYNPDILAGYFSDGFDLPYLKARAEKNKIKLSLGLDNSQPSFSRGRIMSGKIFGIVHADIFRFIETAYSQYLQSETLSLNEVASELLGEKKKEFDFSKLGKMKEGDWRDFFAYNLQDSILTWKLAEKIWPDIAEFARIIQEPLFDITRDRMAGNVENYILHNLDRFNEIAEKRPLYDEISLRKSLGKYEGAFVFQPEPGLYENICFLDFTSMYASVIVTYNLSLSTLSGEKTGGTAVELQDGKVYFSKEKGFFPSMLEEIIGLRKKYKKEYKENPNDFTKARSNAYKLLANASYGYQGFFGARYYCREAAAATAAMARKSILDTIEKIKKYGFEVIYSDSVDGKTKVIIKKDGKIYEEEIEKLFEKTDNESLGKEYNFKGNIEVLTLDDKGKSIFKPIKYVMRHKTNKKMFKVNFTNNWHIDVTEDHSLMGYQACNFNQSRDNKQNPLKRIIELKPEEIKKKANTIISLKKIPDENLSSKNFPKEVYEFMGYFIGNGSFMLNKGKKDYYLRVSLGSDQEEVFNKLIVPLKNLGYINNHWWSKTRKGDLTINGLKLIELIANDFRNERGKKSIPGWLFNEEEENIASFLRGLFSADGCVMIRNGAPIIKYTSIEEGYIKEVRKLLYRVGISHSLFKENSVNKYKTKNRTFCSGTYSQNIILKNKEEFAKKVGFILERKNKLANIKTKNGQKKSIKTYEFDLQAVKSIEEIKTPEYVYDIEVENNHKFFANYVLVHNTDSIAFLLDDKSEKQVLEVLKKLNSELPGIMELELEDFYKRGIFVAKRTVKIGAKKKYALINKEGKVKIRGFETVRRDWCNLAREVQSKVLDSILKTGRHEKSLEYVEGIIKKLREKGIEKDELIIKSQLTKPISEYVANSPHVTAARKMLALEMPVRPGMIIEYYVSETKTGKRGKGKLLVRERIKLPEEKGEYDIDYYIGHQIIPAVENIFEVFNINLREKSEGKKQMKLGEF